MSGYRDMQEPCTGCNERDAEIRRLKGQDRYIEPCPFTAAQSESPDPLGKVYCPRCTQLAGVFLRDWQVDVYHSEIYIGERRGFLWFKRCVQVPHRHRECHNCRHTWMEHARPENWAEELLAEDTFAKAQSSGKPPPTPPVGRGRTYLG